MNPYPGLRPFKPEEAPFFMGREVVSEAIVTRLRIAPLTVLFARSGVGKSSLLMCRLIPSLAGTSRVAYLNEWGTESPVAAIDRHLSALQSDGAAGVEKPVLVLDQFEDVFKLAFDQEKLWDRLAAWVNVHDAPASILITMREEWLGAWQEVVDYLPDALAALIRLAPLTDRELERAIQRPAEIEGTVAVTRDLVGELLSDLRRPNAYGLGGTYVEAGLLQLVCHRLWDEASKTPERTMDVALYERLGRADRLIQEFVWKNLGGAGTAEAAFTASERVLWVGLTRHLMLDQGVKALVSANTVARHLQMRDLGVAGPAVVASMVSRQSRKYLKTIPEERGQPPKDLVSYIASVLKKAADAGFLKQQRGVADDNVRLYELSHDTLGEILQQFSREFDDWIRSRLIITFGAMAGGLVIWLVIIIVLLITPVPKYVLSTPVPKYVLGVVVWLITIIVFSWIIRRFLSLVYALVAFPIIRRLTRGSVPLKSKSQQVGQVSARHRDGAIDAH